MQAYKIFFSILLIGFMLILIAASKQDFICVDSITRNCSQEVQFSNAANYFYGDGSNLTGVAASASMATLTDANIAAAAQGDILYYAGDGKWGNLSAGDSGKFLKTQGAAANPIWDSAGGGNTASTQITASATAAVSTIYRNYLATGSYIMTLPASGGLSDGDWVGFIHENSLFQNDILAPSVPYLKAGYKFTASATTTDTSGSNTLTASATPPSETAGKDGGGAQFTAATPTYYKIASVGADYQSTTKFSFCGWVKFDSLPGVGSEAILLYPKGDSYNFKYCIYNNGGTYYADVSVETNTGDWNDYSTALDPQPSTGTWYHFAYVVETFDAANLPIVAYSDTTRVKIYWNGSLIKVWDNTGDTLKLITGLFVGIASNETSYPLDGVMDEIYFFKNYTLSQAQVTALAKTAPAFIAANNCNLTIDPDGTDRILGLTSDAGDSLISYGNDVLYLRWTGNNWMVDKTYGTWTDNN